MSHSPWGGPKLTFYYYCNGHFFAETPVTVRPLKLSNIELSQRFEIVTIKDCTKRFFYPKVIPGFLIPGVGSSLGSCTSTRYKTKGRHILHKNKSFYLQRFWKLTLFYYCFLPYIVRQIPNLLRLGGHCFSPFLCYVQSKSLNF